MDWIVDVHVDLFGAGDTRGTAWNVLGVDFELADTVGILMTGENVSAAAFERVGAAVEGDVVRIAGRDASRLAQLGGAVPELALTLAQVAIFLERATGWVFLAGVMTRTFGCLDALLAVEDGSRGTAASFVRRAGALALVETIVVGASEAAGRDVIEELLITGADVVDAFERGTLPAALGAHARVAAALDGLAGAVRLARERIEARAFALRHARVCKLVVHGAARAVATRDASLSR